MRAALVEFLRCHASPRVMNNERARIAPRCIRGKRHRRQPAKQSRGGASRAACSVRCIATSGDCCARQSQFLRVARGAGAAEGAESITDYQFDKIFDSPLSVLRRVKFQICLVVRGGGG
jgi:hypothetical protein